MSVSFFLARKSFMGRRAHVYDQLAFALENDAHPASEFLYMYNQARRRGSPLTAVFKRWNDTLRGRAAGRIALAMRDALPVNEYSLLASAEETGRLADGLRFMAKAVVQVEEMQDAISRAVSSNVLPTLVLIGLFIGVDAYFFPMLEETLPRRSWPGLTQFVADLAHNIGTVTGSAMIGVPVVVALWLYTLPRWTGAARRRAETIFLYGKYRDRRCALFLVNLAFLMEAGHAPKESLERIYAHSNPYLRYHIRAMLANINRSATDLGACITSTGLFNEDLAALMSNYARWSDWHTQIRNIADASLRVVTQDIKDFGPRIKVGLQLLIGVCVMAVFGAGAMAMARVLSNTGL